MKCDICEKVIKGDGRLRFIIAGEDVCEKCYFTDKPKDRKLKNSQHNKSAKK